MRVVHYISGIDRLSGGVGSYIRLLCKSLGKMVDLHVVTHHSTDEMDLEHCKIHFISGGISHIRQTKKDFLSLLDEIRPDVVHVNGCWNPLCAYTIFWAKKAGYKVLLTPHGMLEPWNIKKNYWSRKLPALLLYQKRAIRLADMLVATSQEEKANLLKLGYNTHVAVVPIGIDVDEIEMRKDWQQNRLILYVGLLRPNKGPEVLIRSIATIREQLKEHRVVIAGTGEDDYVKCLSRLIDELALKGVVSLVGGIYGDEKWNLYRQADVFVLPTLHENFGIVIAESLASGTPVITTQGAPWEELEICQCGWWVKRTKQNIASMILKAVKLPVDERRAMGMRGRALIERKYSAGAMGTQMKNLYINS